METGIEVEGAVLLRRKLRQVNKELPKRMSRIHDEIARPVVALAKQKARRKTGRMVGTIRSRATTTMARVSAGPLVYAPIQHFGWPGHNIEPNPFLTDAMTERTDESVRLYESMIDGFLRYEGLL